MGSLILKTIAAPRTGICPRCLNERDGEASGLSRRDNETTICEPCTVEEVCVDAGRVKSEEAEAVYERELRMRFLCPEGLVYFTEAGAEFMQECWIRKVIAEVIVPSIRKIEE